MESPLHAYLQRNRINQCEFARRLTALLETPVPQSQVNFWCRGRHIPRGVSQAWIRIATNGAITSEHWDAWSDWLDTHEPPDAGVTQWKWGARQRKAKK